MIFWYRCSPEPLTGLEFHDDLLTPGIVRRDDPPPVDPGMIDVILDSYGRLLYFKGCRGNGWSQDNRCRAWIEGRDISAF